MLKGVFLLTFPNHEEYVSSSEICDLHNDAQIQFFQPVDDICTTVRVNDKTLKSIHIVNSGEEYPSTTPIIISAYGYRTSEDGAKCQFMIGREKLTLKDLLSGKNDLSISLFGEDASHCETARLFISSITWSEPIKINTLAKCKFPQVIKFNGDECHPRYPVPSHLSSKVSGPASDAINACARTHISHYKHGWIPVWATCMSGETRTSYAVLEDYGRLILSWKPDISDSELLAQVVGGFAWVVPYLIDKTFMHGSLKMTEQFSYPRSKPDIEHWSGDCEDLTRCMLHIFYLIHFGPNSNSPIVSRLKKTAALYDFCTTDATISLDGKSGLDLSNPLGDSASTAQLHQYAVLMPWYEIKRRLEIVGGEEEMKTASLLDQLSNRSKGMPILSLESTDHCLGTVERTSFYNQCETFSFKWREMLHQKNLPQLLHTVGILYTLSGFEKDHYYRTHLAYYPLKCFHMFGISMIRPIRDGRFGVAAHDAVDVSNSSIGWGVWYVPNREEKEKWKQYLSLEPPIPPLQRGRYPQLRTQGGMPLFVPKVYHLSEATIRSAIESCGYSIIEHVTFTPFQHNPGVDLYLISDK